MPLQATSGAASYDAFGGGVPVVPNYIEDVFSTYLYTGNGSTQTITNGIDLSTKGGLVWVKRRATVRNHLLFDTNRGVGREIYSNTTDAQNGPYDTLTSFNTTGFSLGTEIDVNASGQTMASWTFRKQPKFFDVVTFTQTGGTGYTTVAHNLGSVPGCIIMKCTSTAGVWAVYHRSIPAFGLALNTTWDTSVVGQPAAIDVTSTEFKLNNTDWGTGNSATWVAYIYAHNAGGFGLTGTDNVISCGSYTGTSNFVGPVVNLGFEPQWLLIKSAGSVKDWVILDNMRGLTADGTNEGYLLPNTSDAENLGTLCKINSTGFQASGSSLCAANGIQYIYIAIRRGPMKVPTSGTSVFSPNISSGSTGTVITTNFPVDMQINAVRDISFDKSVVDRLRGVVTTPTDTLATRLRTNLTNAEGDNFYSRGWNNTGFQMPTTIADVSDVFWSFRRAPSFFDEVCYTGTYPTVNTQTHNLGVAPEWMIVKNRSGTSQWSVYSLAWLNSLGLKNRFGVLNTTANLLATDTDIWNNTLATSTSFQVNATSTNANGSNFVAYLFATCPGVSKCGIYTGNGSTQTIDCGFGAGGARFVIIKRADSTGSWYVWDSSRGIVSGNDPYLLLNSTAAEVTNTDYIDTYSAGFEISSTAPAEINASGGSFIFLAIS